MEFEEWMHSQDLSVSTIKKYAGAIDGVLSEWGNSVAQTKRHIRSIQDAQEFAELAELIGSTDIFNERNERGKSMYSAALNCYGRYLAADASQETAVLASPYGKEILAILADEAMIAPFDPAGIGDGRQRVLRAVVRRQGQPKFRAAVMEAYDSECAISGCQTISVLEAAHITPYLGPETNSVSNGLLLRADIHTLWDLSLIAIDPATRCLAVNDVVVDASYQALCGKPVSQPKSEFLSPSEAALRQQWDNFRQKGQQFIRKQTR